MGIPNKRKNDRWAFLDEIEAPMWADLTLEPIYENGTDVEDWFHMNHPFHQYSSRRLKSAFSHFPDGSKIFDYDLQGPSSPKLPPSVSRSRGKDYKGKTCRHEPSNFTYHLGNQEKNKPCMQGGSNCKMKQKMNTINPKVLPSTLITGLTSKISRSSLCKPPNACNGSETSICKKTTSTKTSESDSKSCISYENDLVKQQSSLKFSSQALSSQSKLVSTIKINLRRSIVARQASRIQIKGQRYGCNSLSVSSSVGSSSSPSNDLNVLNSMPSEGRETTPDSRNVARLNHADIYRKGSYNPSKVSIVSAKEGTSRLNRTAKADGAIAALYPSAKAKHHIVHEKLPQLHKAQEKKSLITVLKAKETKKMLKVSSQKKLVHTGKENAKGAVTLNQMCSKRNVDGAMGRSWRGKSVGHVMKG